MIADRARVRAVLFDKDGTLLDFQGTWAPLAVRLLDELSGGDDALAQGLAEAAGFDRGRAVYLPESPLASGDGSVLIDRWLALLPDHTETSLKLLVYARAAAVIESGLAPASRDLTALLERLRGRGLALGVATHDLEISARAQLRKLAVDDRFAFVAGADSGYGRKPDPAVVDAFCDAVGAAAHEVAVVGDSPVDLALARAAGAGAAIGVLTGPAPRETLEPLADHVIESIDDLPDVLGV